MKPESLAALRRVLPTEEAGQAYIRAKTPMLSTLDAVPVLRRGFDRPEHLAEMASLFERAEAAARGEGPPVFATVSAPSQVGKTTVGEVAYATWLKRRPQDTLAYLPYGQDLADDKSRRIRDDVKFLGVELRDDSRAVDRWTTKQGGGLLARGLSGGITGQPGIACLWIDDPYRNRVEAESAAHARRVLDGVKSVVFTRRQPITSVIVSHTRWTPNDLIGWLAKEHGDRFESWRVPAVGDDGEPLVTIGGRTKEFWADQRAIMGEHDWWSLMMGLPRAREGSLFKDTFATYITRPIVGRIVIGLDFAYSTRTSSDHSVAVVLMRVDERAFVLEVVRKQCEPAAWVLELQALKLRYPSASMHAYIGGQEGGVVSLLSMQGVHVNATPARLDKMSRALTTANEWNAGRIAVPESAPWADDFVSELLNFSGAPGGTDDQVDALVGAYDAAPAQGIGVGPITQPGRIARRWDGPEQGAAQQSGWQPGMGRPVKRTGW